MFCRIILTAENDTIEFNGRTPNHMNKRPGQHLWCRGHFQRHQTSDTHQALFCDTCGLRVVIPIEVKRYQDLQRHFARFNPSESGAGKAGA